MQQTSDRGKILKDLYKICELEFETEKGQKEDGKKNDEKQDENTEVECSTKVKRPVAYADATEILKTVVNERGIDGNYFVKVYSDYGQKCMKLSFSVIPEDYLKAGYEDADESDEQPNKRTRYAEGGMVEKKIP